LSSRTRRVVNRASDALRLAASSLERSQSALGGFARRMKARLGAAEGITATQHKLARIIYRLIKHGEAYVRQGLEDYEKKFAARKIERTTKKPQSHGPLISFKNKRFHNQFLKRIFKLQYPNNRPFTRFHEPD